MLPAIPGEILIRHLVAVSARPPVVAAVLTGRDVEPSEVGEVAS